MNEVCTGRGLARGMKNAVGVLATLAVIAGLSGCLERRVSITSDPAGAVVFINDVELGRTPVEAEFTYYGEYDVRVEKPGYEPLRTMAKASAPIYEYPPFDLLASAVPLDIETVVPWHFVLQPALETTMPAEELEKGMMERAKEMRGMVEPSTTKPNAAEGASKK